MWVFWFILSLVFLYFFDPELLIVLGILFILAIIIAIIIASKVKPSRDQVKSEQKTESTNPKDDEMLGSIAPNPSSSINTESECDKFPEYTMPKRPAPIKIEVKGLDDEERSKIVLGFSLENILIDGLQYHEVSINESNLSEYAKKTLAELSYPFSWDIAIASQIKGKILLIDYRLPSVEDMPPFLVIEYKKNNPVVIEPTEKRISEFWTDVSYKIVIRSFYELFSAEALINIDSICFNGFVKSLDLATGNETEKCSLSVFVQRDDFEKIDLSRIDAKQCFKRFKGISTLELSTPTPIPPIISMDRDDKRFSESYGVISDIKSDNNLAAMDWRDFENLIRELFEKEFSTKGSEVKITRASKDGGVDAVVFDPDPIRGGKIIIQAKRYTNVVGVSAVRDLYGTVLNEGATKGILVTTSDYGADSYNFAKDKPLSLLNGANLLYLLNKYGHEAYINITEAKKILSTKSDE